MHSNLELAVASASDLATVAALAAKIWRAHYPTIIGQDQTEYMLGWMYSPERLSSDQASGVVFELLRQDGVAVGFCGYQARPPVLTLHKLYLEVSEHGRGLGSYLLRHVEAVARQRGCSTVELGVNKNNAKAIRAYTRNGYRIREPKVTDIGSGYVMDDWIMEKKL